MKPLHKIVMVFTTLLLAATTGHVMQSAVPERSADPVVPSPEPVAGAPSAPALPAAAPAFAQSRHRAPNLDTPKMRAPLADSTPDAIPLDSLAEAKGFAAPGCAAPMLETRATASASVAVTLAVPCLGGQKARIRHEGLTLPITLAADGHWRGTVPALATEAHLTVMLPDGTELAATQAVSGLKEVNRIAVATGGLRGVQLHGLEYGSGPDGPGDVNPRAQRAPDTPMGGWLAVFEDDATQVQIYSAPASMSDVRLELTAAVGPDTCGKDVHAEARRLLRGVAEAPAEIIVAMPACDDGDGMVLVPLPEFPLNLAAAN